MRQCQKGVGIQGFLGCWCMFFQEVVIFGDVVVYFFWEEWQCLDFGQRVFYREVMLENYSSVVGLVGFLVFKFELIFWLEQGEELWVFDLQGVEGIEVLRIFKIDFMIRIENEQFCEDMDILKLEFYGIVIRIFLQDFFQNFGFGDVFDFEVWLDSYLGSCGLRVIGFIFQNNCLNEEIVVLKIFIKDVVQGCKELGSSILDCQFFESQRESVEGMFQRCEGCGKGFRVILDIVLYWEINIQKISRC